MSTDTRAATGGAPDRSAVLAVARFEGRNRVRVTIILSVLFAAFGLFYLWIGPEFVAGEPVQEMLDSLPEILNELFGFESLASLEGLLASEFYTLGWIVGFAAYIAYTAAGTVAGDLQGGRMDGLLASPISRWSVLLGKYLALLVPILVLNAVVPATLYAGSVAVGSPIAIVDLGMFHLLSIPYLLFWGATGLLLGVTVRGGRRAGRVALGLVFLAWLFESVISTTDIAWVGGLSPTRYLDPPGVLVSGIYDVAGGVFLLVLAVGFLGLSHRWFRRSDL